MKNPKHLTKNQYDKRDEFQVAELAPLFDRTLVRVWQLVNEGKVKFTYRQEDVADGRSRANRRGIRIPKSQVKVLKEIFRTESLKFAKPAKKKVAKAVAVQAPEATTEA